MSETREEYDKRREERVKARLQEQSKVAPVARNADENDYEHARLDVYPRPVT